jgi:hypothetical protein
MVPDGRASEFTTNKNAGADSGCRVTFLLRFGPFNSGPPSSSGSCPALLYVASPGIRNYVEYGGVGILVFDIDNGYKFVRRIPTWDVPERCDME